VGTGLEQFVTERLLDVLERLDDLLPVGALTHETHVDVGLLLLLRTHPGPSPLVPLELELWEEQQHQAHCLFNKHYSEEECKSLQCSEELQ